MNPLICALDTDDLARLRLLADAVAPHVGGLKIGLQAYTALGRDAVDAAAAAAPVFLDLKLHDIPATVAGAAAAANDLGVAMLTVHASGGPAMVEAAVAAAPDVAVLGVTVLTSLDDAALTRVGQSPVAEQVPRLARLAVEAGAAGVVCAAAEVASVRAAIGDSALIVVPGIRTSGDDDADQARVGTPAGALADGADRLVVGRPITGAANPAAAAAALSAVARATRALVPRG